MPLAGMILARQIRAFKRCSLMAIPYVPRLPLNRSPSPACLRGICSDSGKPDGGVAFLDARGTKHTVLCALITQYLMTLADGYSADADLVLHLIASHHGHARPLLPIVTDNANHQLSVYADGIEMTAELPRAVDMGHADAFHLLNRRYGRWGLALLEAVVRCADMTVSGEGS